MTPAQRHHMFFYHDGTHVFQVCELCKGHDLWVGHLPMLPLQAGRFLFKVHASVLADKAEAFDEMFKANLEVESTPIDGHSEESPISLPPSVSGDAFELFLSVCYHK